MTDYRQICYNALSADAYWQVNKSIAKMFSNDAAILLADLISKERYFYNKDELTENGYFFNTGANIEEDTNITVKKQKTYIETLEKAGLISTILMGIPAKKHFKINHQAIIEVMQVKQNPPNKYSQIGETCIAENAKLYNRSNKNKLNKNKEEVVDTKAYYGNVSNAQTDQKATTTEKNHYSPKAYMLGCDAEQTEEFIKQWNSFADKQVKPSSFYGIQMKINDCMQRLYLTWDGLKATLSNYREAVTAPNTKAKHWSIGRWLLHGCDNYTPDNYAKDNYVWEEQENKQPEIIEI